MLSSEKRRASAGGLPVVPVIKTDLLIRFFVFLLFATVNERNVYCSFEDLIIKSLKSLLLLFILKRFI
jgi:hypothetical protein